MNKTYHLREDRFVEDRQRIECIYKSDDGEVLTVIYPRSERPNIKTVIEWIGHEQGGRQ